VEADLDLLIAVADRPVRQPEDPQQIDVALHGRGDLGQLDTARRGDIGHARGQARGNGMQQVLHRRGGVVISDQHRRVIGIHGRDVLVLHLLQRAVEPGQCGPVMGPVHPGVAGPELELRDLGLSLDRVERREQRRGVHSIATSALGSCGGHASSRR
jgi:hypothetical protein